MKAVDFGKYLQSKFYPHIAPENLFGTKVTFLKTFYRSALVLSSWTNLISTVNTMLAASKLELSRDAVIIVIRDWSKPLREQLEEEEMAKYANQTYRDHVHRKFNENKNMQVQKRSHDGLLEAAQSRKPDYSKMQGRPEVGVKIQVGVGQDGS